MLRYTYKAYLMFIICVSAEQTDITAVQKLISHLASVYLRLMDWYIPQQCREAIAIKPSK